MASYLNNGLTVRQTEVLAYIQTFSSASGYPPTLREIGTHFHIAPTSVLAHLKALEKKKFIRRLPFKPRCVEILKREGFHAA